MRCFALFLMIFSLSINLDAQWHDRYWITGYNVWEPEKGFGSSYFDFFEEPVHIYHNQEQILDMKECSAIGSSYNGELLFYTNCMSVHSSFHLPIAGIDSIAYGYFWTNWIADNGETWGFPLAQGGVVLPVAQNTYMLLYSTADLTINVYPAVSHVYAAIIVVDTMLSQPMLIQKDQIVIQDTLTWGKIAACRHGNGKDWWVLAAEYSSNTYYSINIQEHGDYVVDTIHIGNSPFTNAGVGQAYFSADGTKYIRFDGINRTDTGGLITVYDFDRCAGLLSNERWLRIPHYSIGGVAISPNSRYLYATDAYSLWQYDLYAEDIAASQMTVAEFDGYVEPNWFPTYFGMMAPGPDGRIYIIPPTGGSMVMHVIDQPDERGEACRVLQHHIKLPTWNARTLPNFPNFRLGPVDGSACDTLGVDNLPVARFRHEAEEDDLATIRFTDLSYYAPEVWEWDFGDGTIASGAHQLHRYTVTGTYTVCLTVSNANASHTSCQEVYAEVVSASGSVLPIKPLSVYPNPFDDHLTFELPRHEIIGIHITDLHGKAVFDVEMTCPCTISLRHLPAGVYFWNVTRRDGRVESGKVVRI